MTNSNNSPKDSKAFTKLLINIFGHNETGTQVKISTPRAVSRDNPT